MYILRADIKDNLPVYYMNFVMYTGNKEYAQPFKSKKAAMPEIERFECILKYNHKDYIITTEQLIKEN